MLQELTQVDDLQMIHWLMAEDVLEVAVAAVEEAVVVLTAADVDHKHTFAVADLDHSNNFDNH